MNKVAIIIISLILVLVVVFGGCTQPAPATSFDGSVTIEPTNSESASRIAELEARIRELEAENQSLLMENRQLNSDLQKMEAENRQLLNQLDIIQNLTTSSKYTNALSNLETAQIDTSDLADWTYGLPDLPELPLGLNLREIREAIDIANFLRQILDRLPRPPILFAPPFWVQLDDMKETFISMTEWMGALEDLPEFLMKAEELEDIKPCIQNYLENVDTAVYDAKEILEQVRDASRR